MYRNMYRIIAPSFVEAGELVFLIPYMILNIQFKILYPPISIKIILSAFFLKIKASAYA